MKKITLSIVLIIIVNVLYSQQIHVKYVYVRSPIATLYEDLYIKNKNIISIQDSIVTRPPSQGSDDWIMVVGTSSKSLVKKVKPLHYISDLKDGNIRDFFFTSSPLSIKDQTLYFIHDQVPKPNWVIDEKNTKTILNYKCTKATAYFRGSEIVAYFTRELPFSAGPFKFFGLPGLILDIRENGKSFNIWKAEKIDLDDKTNINYKPEFNGLTKLPMKEFVDHNNELLNRMNAEIMKNLPNGTRMNSGGSAALEKKFEWE